MSIVATRTDVHRPAALVTEDYEFAFCDVHHPPEGEFPPDARARVERVNALLDEGFRFDDVHGAGQCSHCGTRINYYAVLKHLPTKTLIHVGETCLDNRFELATSEFHRLRKRAELGRQEQRIKLLREEWRAAHSDEAVFLDAHEDSGFYRSLGRSLKRYGSLTDRQLDALNRSIAREREEMAKDEAEAWAMYDAGGPVQLVPVPDFDGRTQIVGTVEAIYWKKGYGYNDSRHVMTVLDDRGFKLWGTVPAALNAEKGDHVTFTAEIERSDKDETFGFFKRPRTA